MNTSTRHHGSLELGQQLSAIHTHRQRDVMKWPWILLGLAALILGTWALLRRPTVDRAIDTTTRNIPTTTHQPAPADRTTP